MEKPKKPYSDTEVKNLWWRPKADGGEMATFRKVINDKDVWRKLDMVCFTAADKKVARQMVKEQLAKLGQDEFARRLGIGAAPVRAVSTVQALLDAYTEYWKGTGKIVNTRKKNCTGLLLILKRGAGATAADSLSVLTLEAGRVFASETIKAVQAEAQAEGCDREELDKRTDQSWRSIKAYWRQAMSLFSDAALTSPEYKALVLPDWVPALKKMRWTAKKPVYWRLSAPIVRSIMDGIAELRQTEPELFLAAMLELLCGSRVGSVADAKWSWFSDTGEVDFSAGGRRIVRYQIRRSKAEPVNIPVFESDYKVLLSARVGTGDYILPGAKSADRYRILAKRLCPWLRARGLDRPKPNYELRRLFGDTKQKMFGDSEAASSLGHTSLANLPYYTERNVKHALAISDMIDPQNRLKEKVLAELAQ